MKDFILFLVRMKLRLRKGRRFKFKNQSNKEETFVIDDKVLKITKVKIGRNDRIVPFIDRSNLSLNFLLSNEAKEMIIRL